MEQAAEVKSDSERQSDIEHVLVTGGAGYIGSVLAEQLLNEGYEVTVYDRLFFDNGLADLADNPRLHVVRGDIRTIEPEIFNGVDAVFDLAALSNDPAGDLNPNLTLGINFLGRLNVAKQAKAKGVSRYVLASSCSIYGQNPDIVDELQHPNPQSTYAFANYAAEQSTLPLADEGFVTTALRQATVYGPSRGNAPKQGRMRFDLVVNIFAKALAEGRELTVDPPGTQRRPLVHVQDTARAFIETLKAPAEIVSGQAFNIGSPEQNFQVKHLAKVACRAVGLDDDRVVLGSRTDERNYEVDFWRAQEELGYDTRHTVAEAVRDIKDRIENRTIDTSHRTLTLQRYDELLEKDRSALDPVVGMEKVQG